MRQTLQRTQQRTLKRHLRGHTRSRASARAVAHALLILLTLPVAFPLPLTTAAHAAIVLNRGNDGDPETLDPHKTSTVAEANILGDLYEGLVINDRKADVVPGVAESWTISPDGLVYTFKLRGTARWSNGDPVVAGDFVYSLRRLLDPATGSKYAPVMYPLANAEKIHKGLGAPPSSLGVRALDQTTLEIRLERPTIYFIELLTNQTALPVHAGAIERLGADWSKPGVLVSNGAYTLKSFVPNGSIVLTRNAKFHAAASVQIDEVRYFPTADAGAAARRFRAGELQITTDVPTDQFADLKARLGDQVRTAPYLGTSFLIVNTRKKPFDDVRVRRALALGVDREFLADEIWSGTMLPAFGMIPPNVKNYPERAELDFAQATPIEREDEARDLLTAAGFGKGKPLSVELRYNMTDNNQRTMVAIASQWKQIGVETRFVHTDGKTHFAYLRDGGDFDVARYGWIADYSDAQNFLFLLESANVGLNVGGYANAAFDTFMRRAADEPDAKRRAKLLLAADQTFVRDLPWIPLMFYQSKALVSTKVRGFVANQQAVHATRFLSLAQP